MKVFSSRVGRLAETSEPSRVTPKATNSLAALVPRALRKFQANRVPTNNYLFSYFAQLRPIADSFLL
jgi:hypothetical protein